MLLCKAKGKSDTKLHAFNALEHKLPTPNSNKIQHVILKVKRADGH
jgi:hypothetical protein